MIYVGDLSLVSRHNAYIIIPFEDYELSLISSIW